LRTVEILAGDDAARPQAETCISDQYQTELPTKQTVFSAYMTLANCSVHVARNIRRWTTH